MEKVKIAHSPLFRRNQFYNKCIGAATPLGLDGIRCHRKVPRRGAANKVNFTVWTKRYAADQVLDEVIQELGLTWVHWTVPGEYIFQFEVSDNESAVVWKLTVSVYAPARETKGGNET